LNTNFICRLPLNTLTRKFSATKASGGFKEKSFKEAWLSDPGAYPVMGVIAFAVTFGTGAIFFFLGHADSRVAKSSRSTLFRGELKGAQ
jgi:hypothetical protein